jgi:hypothetical protein
MYSAKVVDIAKPTFFLSKTSENESNLNVKLFIGLKVSYQKF